MTQPPEDRPYGWQPAPPPAWPGPTQPDPYGRPPVHGQPTPYGQPVPFGQPVYEQPPVYGQPYGQGWPPAPGWGPPPERPRNRTAVVVLSVVGGVLALALVAVGLVAVLRTVEDGAAPVADAAFLDSLPADFDDCAAMELAGDGDVAAAGCGASATRPGPWGADFYRYEDGDTLDDVFIADVATPVEDGGIFLDGLAPFDGPVDCATGSGWGEWTEDGAGGMVACGLSDQGDVAVMWTDDVHLTEGVVYASGTTQSDVAALFAWWDQHSSFEG
ncbi:hypothetical protein [Modestobacter sp. NPDC049651]|uniref:hypothetical protein n=1 Tax=unclassified Modestobacter TaxID=2643866 RepID=UPI0033DB266E